MTNQSEQCTELPTEWKETFTANLPVNPGELVMLSCVVTGTELAGSRFLGCLTGDQFYRKQEPSCLGRFVKLQNEQISFDIHV